jgi:L,D-transpeptidase catalytic domain
MSSVGNFFRHGGKVAWGLILAVVLLVGATTTLMATTVSTRYERDVNRMAFNHNLEVLDKVKAEVGASTDTLSQRLSAAPELSSNAPYIVVSIAENRIWYKQGDSVLFTTQVATGSGKSLDHEGGGDHWKFETPRGRLVVQKKDTAPAWIPPDWHFVEMAQKKGMGLIRLQRGQSIAAGDGAEIVVDGEDVVKRYSDGREVPFAVKEGHEITAGGNIVVPPIGTNQRKYLGVLGTHRLEMGDGYGIHGTDDPSSIGKAASHGCVRLRNEDIAKLYDMVPIGTAVYIY